MDVPLTPEVLRDIVAKLIILILSICVHEFGHAFVADKLGDRLPRSQGRVTLNPFAHVDPIGTLALPGFALFISGGATTGFGWGKPVMVQPVSFSRRFSMRTGHMFVAFAGPAMNVLFALFLAVLLYALIHFDVFKQTDLYRHGTLAAMLSYAVAMNFVLFFFNLIPSAPLDGGAVMEGLLPRRLLPGFHEFQKYAIFLLIAIIMSDKLAVIFLWPAYKLHHLLLSTVLGLY